MTLPTGDNNRGFFLLLVLFLLGLTVLVFAFGVSSISSGRGLPADIVFVELVLVLLTLFFFYGIMLQNRPPEYYRLTSWPRVAPEELLDRYKRILAAILPAKYLGEDGLLEPPADSAPADRRTEYIKIIPPAHRPERLTLNEFVNGNEELLNIPHGAYYRGGLAEKLLRHHLRRSQSLLPQAEYRALSKYAQNEISSLPRCDTIDLRGQKRAGSLAHEAFHDIQGYLLDYHPEVFDALLAAVSQSRESIVRWYNDPHTTQWRTDDDYQLMHIFPRTPEDVPYRSEWLLEAVNFCKRETGSRFLSNRFWGDVYAEIMKDLGRVEAIPVLLAAAAERNKFAGRILSRIFGTVGLNADFYDRMPLLE